MAESGAGDGHKGARESESKEDPDTRRLELELHQAVREGDKSKTLFLLNRGVSAVADDGYGSQPLHKASANGHTDVVRVLLEAGAPNAPNRSGNTPLHWACQLGHEDVVETLLKHFGEALDVLQKNKFGRTALTEAMSAEHETIVQLLLKHSSVGKALPKAEEASADDVAETEAPTDSTSTGDGPAAGSSSSAAGGGASGESEAAKEAGASADHGGEDGDAAAKSSSAAPESKGSASSAAGTSSSAEASPT